MIWMPSSVQANLFYGAILGGLTVGLGGTANAGFGGPGATGTTTSGTATAATSGVAAGGGRSAAPAETGRAPQGNGSVAREAAVQNAAAQPQRAAVANQAAYHRVANQASYRTGEAFSNDRVPSSTENRETTRPANAWTDAAGAGRQPGFYTGHLVGSHHNGYRRSPGSQNYLYRYYGGYYPIYVDVPVVYYAPDFETGYDGGPNVVPDPGNGVAPVIPPSSISVSPQDDSAAQPDGSAATPAPDVAQDGGHAPNPSIGPDSLVEAVQTELTRRGYYQGKVDAMFRADTEAALRHFQQDNYLAPTGHLNEPTLHALNLD
jgi:hypothetical protein